MDENISTHLAALNAAWQRYARTAEEQLDSASAEALNRDYCAAWEGLDACGIAEWMLAYDPTTLTFSLPTTEEMGNNDCATMPVSAVTNRTAGSRWRRDAPDSERRQLISQAGVPARVWLSRVCT
jgi:hypothetical protein